MVNNVTEQEFINYLFSKGFEETEKDSAESILNKYLDSYKDGSDAGNIGIGIWIVKDNNCYEIWAFMEMGQLFPTIDGAIKHPGKSYKGPNCIKNYDLDRFNEAYSEMENNLKEALSVISSLEINFSDE